MELNILGTKLESCSCDPMTGWFRNGFCSYDFSDKGLHTVCAIVTLSFLNYSKAQGNDLSTPNISFSFPGLKNGDMWCLCALRWKQAYDDGFAPFIKPESTHQKTLEIVNLETLMKYDIKKQKNIEI